MTIILLIGIAINALLLENSRDVFSKFCFFMSMAILLLTLFYHMCDNYVIIEQPSVTNSPLTE